MKIRDKLTLTYSTATTIVVLALGLFIYLFTAQYHDREFFSRLDERVEITEQLFLEEGNLAPEVYRNIRDKFLHTLDNETEIVKEITQDSLLLMDSLFNDYPKDFIVDLFLNGESHFNGKKMMGAGKIFFVPRGRFVIIVQAEDLFGKTKLQHLGRILAIGLPCCILVIVIIGMFVSGRALSPVKNKIDQVNAITASKLHKRLDVLNENDEIGALAKTFNELLERLENAFNLQKKFISNASHEIRNPLAAILGESDVALTRDRSPEDYKASLTKINDEANRLNQLVNNLLHLAKTDADVSQLTYQEFRLDEIMMDVQRSISFSHPDNKVQLVFPDNIDDMDELVVKANVNLIESALYNLLDNAIKFSSNQTVIFALSNEKDRLTIKIIDQGIGIPTPELDKINHTFYRASNARSFKGFGIGLPLVQKIFDLHGFDFTIAANHPTGTKVELSIKKGENQD
ncbi:MAG: HAMP domain-containing protein [Saprospiraceae bacterium]|nr:HAMP domain-containing protein [Saprospiraceae bacterium]